MKKIMFNDRYGLTQAVLEGRKTQTRRIATIQPPYKNSEIAFPTSFLLSDEPEKHPLWLAYCWVNKDNDKEYTDWIKPKYQEMEIVAIAQSYKDIDNFYKIAFNHKHSTHGQTVTIYDTVSNVKIRNWFDDRHLLQECKGWNNKMFSRSDLMPNWIRITKVRIQRLQDISDNDCIKEGIFEDSGDDKFPPSIFYDFEGNKDDGFDTPREAYAALIDKINGKGTWESNPYVWVYEFELVKWV
jgi:hypothetical protein|nr:MAG TPA: ASCH domain protein [Caudoviricetes sp.]